MTQICRFDKNISSLGGLEPPTFRLTAERANRLRHRDFLIVANNSKLLLLTHVEVRFQAAAVYRWKHL